MPRSRDPTAFATHQVSTGATKGTGANPTTSHQVSTSSTNGTGTLPRTLTGVATRAQHPPRPPRQPEQVIGAVAGLVLMWLSRAWTRTEKWIATLTPLAVIAVSIIAAVALSTRPTPPATGAVTTRPTRC